MRRHILQAALLVAVSLLVYSNTLLSGFVFDDVQNILENRWIRDFSHIPDIFSRHVAGFDKGFATSYYRPLIHLFYMLNYKIFGLNAWGYHLVNVLFHTGVVILLFLLIRRFAREKGPDFLSAPFLAALLFAVHPVHTEAVSWIAGLMDLSFSFFYLLAFYFYIRSGGAFGGSYTVSLLSFFLATISKEPALTLPGLLVAYDYAFKKEGMRTVPALKRYAPYLFVIGIYFALRVNALQGIVPSKKLLGLTDFQYVLNVFPLFIKYLEKLAFPLSLTALHLFKPVKGVLELKSILSLLFTFAFILCAWLAIKKDRKLALGFILTLVPLLPALYIPGVTSPSVFAERYLYLPSSGLAVLVAFLIGWMDENRENWKIAGRGALLLISAVLALATFMHNAVWKDNLSLWSDTAKKSPESAEAHAYLGYALYESGDVDGAIREYRTAIRLKPGLGEARLNLGVAYFQKGLFEDAISEYGRALLLEPGSFILHNNIGLCYMNLGDPDRAAEHYRTALSINPGFSDAHNNLGIAYWKKGLKAEAIKEFEAASILDPENPDYGRNLYMAREFLGRNK